MLGIAFSINRNLCIRYDLSNHVNIEKGIANVHLPEIVDPIPIRNNIKVLYAECNPKLIYQGDASGTLKGWNYMNDIDIPLGKTTTILAMGEISTIFAQGMFSAVPLVVSRPHQYPA